MIVRYDRSWFLLRHTVDKKDSHSCPIHHDPGGPSSKRRHELRLHTSRLPGRTGPVIIGVVGPSPGALRESSWLFALPAVSASSGSLLCSSWPVPPRRPSRKREQPSRPRTMRHERSPPCLRQELVSHWYPGAIDKEHGGFHQNFARDWSPRPDREQVPRLPGAHDLDRRRLRRVRQGSPG